MEAPATLSGGALALSPAAVGGKRRKLKLVTRKVARKALKKMGLKMRGGEGDAAAPVAVPAEMAKAGGADPAAAPSVAAPAMGGKRKTKKRSASRRKSIFGL
jgi:hypothetical protein